MRIVMMTIVTAMAAMVTSASANATALMDRPAASYHGPTRTATPTCPRGWHWQPTQYYTRHDSFRPAGCVRG
jgi:hypothetical protein